MGSVDNRIGIGIGVAFPEGGVGNTGLGFCFCLGDEMTACENVGVKWTTCGGEESKWTFLCFS